MNPGREDIPVEEEKDYGPEDTAWERTMSTERRTRTLETLGKLQPTATRTRPGTPEDTIEGQSGRKRRKLLHRTIGEDWGEGGHEGLDWGSQDLQPQDQRTTGRLRGTRKEEQYKGLEGRTECDCLHPGDRTGAYCEVIKDRIGWMKSDENATQPSSSQSQAENTTERGLDGTVQQRTSSTYSEDSTGTRRAVPSTVQLSSTRPTSTRKPRKPTKSTILEKQPSIVQFCTRGGGQPSPSTTSTECTQINSGRQQPPENLTTPRPEYSNLTSSADPLLLEVQPTNKDCTQPEDTTPDTAPEYNIQHSGQHSGEDSNPVSSKTPKSSTPSSVNILQHLAETDKGEASKTETKPKPTQLSCNFKRGGVCIVHGVQGRKWFSTVKKRTLLKSGVYGIVTRRLTNWSSECQKFPTGQMPCISQPSAISSSKSDIRLQEISILGISDSGAVKVGTKRTRT